MKKRIIKLLVVAILFLLPKVGGGTSAYFSATAEIVGNTVSAGYWVAPTLVYPTDGTIVNAGSAWDINPYMDWDYSLAGPGVQYIYQSAHTDATGPDGSFVSPVYTSSLLADTQIPAPGTPDGVYYWHVRAFINGSWTPWSEIWMFTVDRTVAPPPTGSGLVINEVYYDAIQTGSDALFEWFELYNNSDNQIVMTNWTIEDNTNTNVLPAMTINSHAFVIVASQQSGYLTNFNDGSGNPITNGAQIFYLARPIGGGLGNSGDRLVLKNGAVEIDAVSWGADGYAFGAGNGIMPLTGNGKSIARKIKGVDTNSPLDWEILNSPNPGTNPHPPSPTPTETPVPSPVIEPTVSVVPTETPTPTPTTAPAINFAFRADKRAVGFTVANIADYDSLQYQVAYKSDSGEKGMMGEILVNNQDSISRDNLLLGTCSALGEVCVYDSGLTDINLIVKLLKNGEKVFEQTKTLIY